MSRRSFMTPRIQNFINKITIPHRPAISIVILLSGLIFFWPLPDRLSVNTSLELISTEGILLGEFREKQTGSFRNKVNIDEIPKEFINIILIAEDKRFYYTPGFDPLAILRATFTNTKEGRIVSGASGITMQLIRILYHDYLPKSIWIRKPVEVYLASKLSLYNSDKRILEAYINTVPMPMNTTGLPAASQLIFARNINSITAEEMASLVILIRQNNTTKTALTKRMANFYNRLNKKRNIKLDQKLITEISNHIIANQGKFKRSKSMQSTPHFLIYIKNKFPNLQGRLLTTIQDNLHHDIKQIIKNEFALLEQKGAEDVSVVVLESVGTPTTPKKIKLRALVGSRNFYDPVKGQINGALIQRNAGSSLKPFIYALAFDKLSLRPFDIIEDSPINIRLGNASTYRPRNYDLDFWGKMSIREALATSRNIPAVRLVDRLSVPVVYQFFQDAGFELEKSADHYGPGIALGSAGARLLGLTHAYSIFPNQGTLYPLVFLQDSNDENAIYNKTKRLVSQGSAFYISSILSDKTARRRSFGSRNFLDFPFEVAAKTGTSKDYKDSWTIGFTGRFIVGVWVGRFSNGPMNGVSGSAGAGRIFQQTVRVLNNISKIENSATTFVPPKGWVRKPICTITGKKAASLCPAHEEWVKDLTPDQICHRHQSAADFDLEKKSQHTQQNHTTNNNSLHENIASQIKSNNRKQHDHQNNKAKIISPVNQEVYFFDPHTPKKAQGVPIEITIPHGDDHNTQQLNKKDTYRYKIDNKNWVLLQENILTTVRAQTGMHTLLLQRNQITIESVTFFIK